MISFAPAYDRHRKTFGIGWLCTLRFSDKQIPASRPGSIILLFAALVMVNACRSQQEPTLPILGETSIDAESGKLVHYTAPAFSFTDQQERFISEATVAGKIHVVDFFFTSCPTICPKMTSHLVQVQDHFEDEPKVGILSYSIDPQHDTPERLAAYAERYQINAERWSLLTSQESDVFALAKDYKVMAFDDTGHSLDGLIHDGTFVLVDDQRRIRGYYNGLEAADVLRLIGDIEILLREI